jgi:hypothetical protein
MYKPSLLDRAIEDSQRNTISTEGRKELAEEMTEKIVSYMMAGGVEEIKVPIKPRFLWFLPAATVYTVSIFNSKGDPTLKIVTPGVDDWRTISIYSKEGIKVLKALA